MEESAFEQFAHRLWQKAFQASRSYRVGDMEAEDIAQETMLRLWQMRDELERYRSLEAVAVQVARHLTQNSLRRQQPASIEEARLHITGSGRTPAEQLEESEDEEWLRQRMDELPTTQYTILYMRQVERRSGREIARLLGIGETSVRTLLARARKTLLEELRKRR